MLPHPFRYVFETVGPTIENAHNVIASVPTILREAPTRRRPVVVVLIGLPHKVSLKSIHI